MNNIALGNHILVEFMNCDPHVMNDVAAIERDMVGAARKAEATVINSTFHHFSPYGVSGVVVIQESHLAIHTWPEYGYAAVDVFTCGDMNAWIAFDHLKECFGAKSYSAIEMKRGSVNLLTRNDFDITSAREKAAEWRNPDFYTRNVWFTDKDEDQALSLRFTGDVFFDVQSPFQRVRILNSDGVAVDPSAAVPEPRIHFREQLGKINGVLRAVLLKRKQCAAQIDVLHVGTRHQFAQHGVVEILPPALADWFCYREGGITLGGELRLHRNLWRLIVRPKGAAAEECRGGCSHRCPQRAGIQGAAHSAECSGDIYALYAFTGRRAGSRSRCA